MTAALVFEGWLPQVALRVSASTAAYGGMLATALGWAAAGRARSPGGPEPATAVLLIGIGALASAVNPLGAALYLATPAWMAVGAARGRLVGLGLGTPVTARTVVLGLLAGAFLGAHLLVCASLTFDYRVRMDVGHVAGAVAIDAGAQVLATECLFRGALLNRLLRERSFAVSAAWSTALYLVRYLVDPLLPGAIEIVVGMLFYVSLLGVTTAWLFWRSGSLIPGGLAAFLFCVAYRLLAVP